MGKLVESVLARMQVDVLKSSRNLLSAGLLLWQLPTMACVGWPVTAGSYSEAKVRECLSLGADVNAEASGWAALHWAAVGDNAPAIRALVVAGADLEKKVDDGATALHWAAKYGNLAAVGALLDSGAAVGARDRHGNEPLSWAARGESEVEMGLWGSPDEYAGNRQAHAHDVLIAADSKSAKAIGLLLEAGAAVDSRDLDGGTALHEAAWLGKARTIRMLCVAGADVEALWQWRGGATPLHVVALRASRLLRLPAGVAASAIAELVAAGADVNAPFGEETLLQMLTNAGNTAAVWILLEAGAEVDARHPRGGHTALHLASLHGASGAVQLMLEAGADVGARDSDGSTPLHWAVTGDNGAAIRMLAEAGADVDGRGGKDNRNAVDQALIDGSVAAIKALAEAGADLGTRGEDDFPLFWARTMERPAFEAWHVAVRRRNEQDDQP